MKTKKTAKADMENKRPLFFMIGLLISLSAVLVAFEWKSPVEKAIDFGPLQIDVPVEEMMPVTKEEKEKVLPPVKEVTVFEIVDNAMDIDETLDIFDSEINEGEAIDVKAIAATTKEDEEDLPPIWFPEQMPEFPGGMSNLMKHINSSIKYPVVAQENGIQGKVIVTFVIDKNGAVTDVKLLRGIDASLDAEALRVVRSLPKWKPGMQNNKPVKVNFNVPISFVLQ